MKKVSIILLVMMMAGCGSMSMQSPQSGRVGDMGYDRTLNKGAYPLMDPSLDPYYRGGDG